MSTHNPFDQLRKCADSHQAWSYLRSPDGAVRLNSALIAEPFGRAHATPPSPSTYPDRVRGALRAIDAGLVEKVVVARRETLPPADPVATLQALDARYPDCWVFAISDGAQTFLGATPELLARVRGREVETCALAGTSPPGDDRLLESEKDLREHRLVVDAIVEALTPLCSSVESAPQPNLRVLPNVQHLHTPIRATLRDDVDAMAVLEALHPTPAVCGTPREAARRLIAELEPFDRGLYAGVVGWVDGDEAELVVAIRSALLAADATWVYAGAGIVAGSDPDAEDRETLAKLDAVVPYLRFA